MVQVHWSEYRDDHQFTNIWRVHAVVTHDGVYVTPVSPLRVVDLDTT